MSPRPLRIAMVTEYAYPLIGGISEHVHFLSSSLVARGHEVTVVTGRCGSPANYRDVDTVALSEHGYRTVRVGRSLPLPMNGSIARSTVGARLAREMRAALVGMDVVHAQGLAGPVLPLLGAYVSEAPVTVGTFHTYVEGGRHWAYRFGPLVAEPALRRLDRRIAVSQVCVESLEPTFPGEYTVIPNGVDCDRFHPLGQDEPSPAGLPRILFVGRLEPRNALAELIRAAALLVDAGYNFTINVAGDGPTRAANERLAARLGVGEKIEWFGLVHDDLPRLYREATVLAAPCTLASFGVILIEALASGLPIVAADNVGFCQVISGDVPGCLVPLRDPQALAAGLAAMLDDPDRRATWSRQGREAAMERFAWPLVAEAVEGVYAECGAGTSVPTRLGV